MRRMSGFLGRRLSFRHEEAARARCGLDGFWYVVGEFSCPHVESGLLSGELRRQFTELGDCGFVVSDRQPEVDPRL